MKGFSLKNAKWLIAPLITLVVIGVMWFYYAVVYLPDRVEYYSGRNLRILATIGNDITSTFENYNSVLQNKMLTHSPTERRGEGEKEKKGAKALEHEFVNYTIRHAFNPVGTRTQWVVTYVPDNSTEPTKFLPRTNFERREFDIVLLVNQEGRVLLQQAPAGIQIGGFDQLMGSPSVSPKKEEDKAEKSQKTESKQAAIPDVTEVREVTVAGQTYMAFVLPVQVPVKLERDASSSLKDTERWVIAGLIKKSRFLSECKSISYTVRSVVISLMIVMLVSIPLIRILTLGERERVRPLNIVMLAYSLLMGTALVTLFLAYMFVYVSDETRLNREANQLAEDIARNVGKELQLASQQLQLLTGLVRDERHQAVHPNQVEAKQGDILKGDILKRENVITGPYPFLRMAFWADHKGDQRVKWFTSAKVTPLINVSERSYFQHARDNRLLTVPLETKDEPHVARLWVEPVYSWTTAENTTVLAMRPLDTEGDQEFEQWVAALETKLLSLINPVIPKGFRYAVIDESGQVLFHSDQQRNLRESFIEETGRDPTIQAAMAGHMNKEGEGVYLGRDQHFVVKPLEWVPWTLVVLRDKQLLRTAGAEGLATATMLLLLYSVLLSVLFIAGWLLCRRNKPSCGHRALWLWPHQDEHLAYRRMLVFNLGMLLILAALLLWGHGWKTLALGAGIPILAAAFAVVQWTRRRTSAHPAAYAKGDLYHLTAVSFILVLSCLPSLAFFKVAYEVEHQLFLKEGQLSLANGLVEREFRVRNAYRDIKLSSHHKEKFFEQRLKTDSDEKTLDVYGRFFAGTKAEYVDKVHSFEAESSWSEQQFLRLIETIRIPFNRVAVRSGGLIHHASSDGTRSWGSVSDARLDLYYRPLEEAPTAAPVIWLSSQIPALLQAQAVFPAAFAMAFVGWSVFAWIGRIGQTIFGCQLMPVSGYPESQASPRDPIGNILVLGADVPNGLKLAPYQLLDPDAATTDDTWIDTVRADIDKARGAAIALLNWDRRIESPLRNQQKLQLLRELLAEGRTVLIQSRTDPTHFELNGEADSRSEIPWLHALRSFSRIYSEEGFGDCAKSEKSINDQEEQALIGLNEASHEEKRRMERAIRETGQVIRDECRFSVELLAIGGEVARHSDLARVTSGEVLEAISRAANNYYQRLWATCSRGEQYVLFALAKDGFVLCTQPEVRNLLQRGLIERRPMLVPFNTTFRQWILDEGSNPSYAKAWRKGEPLRIVTKARHVMVGLLAALGLFLYVTQEEQVGHLMEFGTALFAGIPIIGEWLGQLIGEKAPTTAKA